MLNYDLTEAGEERRLKLSELDDIRAEAYKNASVGTKNLFVLCQN